MKRKLLVLLTCLFIMVGCVLDKTPKRAVEDLFKKYQKLDSAVVNDLEFITEGTTLTNQSLKDSYIKAMEMQYSDLKYEVTDEEIDGDDAIVTVRITVYDFYKAQKEANEYMSDHYDEFLTDDEYDENKFMKYKLESMLDTSDRVDYTIKVELAKEDDEWIVKSFDKTTLEKIHGTYNYERE